jgi:hypothetical protein
MHDDDPAGEIERAMERVGRRLHVRLTPRQLARLMAGLAVAPEEELAPFGLDDDDRLLAIAFALALSGRAGRGGGD